MVLQLGHRMLLYFQLRRWKTSSLSMEKDFVLHFGPLVQPLAQCPILSGRNRIGIVKLNKLSYVSSNYSITCHIFTTPIYAHGKKAKSNFLLATSKKSKYTGMSLSFQDGIRNIIKSGTQMERPSTRKMKGRE